MATEVNLINTDIVAKSITSTNAVTANRITGNGRLLKNLVSSPQVLQMKTYLQANSSVNSSTIPTSYPVFPVTANFDINDSGFSLGATGIAVPQEGVYIVGAVARYFSTAFRAVPEIYPSLNGVVLPENGSNSYLRNASGHNDSSGNFTTILELVSGDEVGLMFRQGNNGGTVNMLDTSHFFMYRIK